MLRSEPVSDGLDGWRDDLQGRLEERRAQARKQLEEWRTTTQELLDRNGFGQRRLLKAFPKLRSVDHRAALERLRRRLERR